MPKKNNGKKLREKLDKLFGMLGSANANEREVAWNKINELLARNRKNWNDLRELLNTGKGEESWQDSDDDAAPPPPAVDPAAPAVDVFALVYFTLEKYLYMRPHELVAVTLWTLHTWVFDLFEFTPRLAVQSPVRGCGKSRVLDCLEKMTLQAQKYDHITGAGLYDVLDSLRPSVLLDECDNLELRTRALLRTIINSGYKAGGTIARKMGGGQRKYSTYAPMALGGIGTFLPLPQLRRCIIVDMARAPGSAKLVRFDPKNPEQIADFDTIYQQLFHWSMRARSTLNLDPAMPPELNSLRADNWRACSPSPTHAGMANRRARLRSR